MSVLKTVLVAADPAPGAEGLISSQGGELLSGHRTAATFDAPADAIRVAVALVAAGEEHKVRVGVDVGGLPIAVEIAERVCAAADPGQALATEAVAHLAGRAVSELLQAAGGVRIPELGRIVSVFAVGPASEDPASGDRKTTVVIADDQELLRAGFRVIIDAESDLRVVGEAADGQAAIDVVRRRRPDVVLMDIRISSRASTQMPPCSSWP